MFAIVGAAGKVGYATSLALRDAGMPVKAILRDESKATRLIEIGCEIAIADLLDSITIAKAIGDAHTVQIILPPSPQAKDTAEEMRRGIKSLASALEEARPKRVLAISDYGAHITNDIGMPTLCRTFEERLSKLDCHKVFLRSAEHMQGWGRAIPRAIESGTLPSFHDPLDMVFPTVSAPDVGVIAADVLLRPASDKIVEIIHAEGPRRYSANDVAAVLSQLLGRTINAEAVPRSQWKGAFESVMSPSLAELLIKANDAQNEGGLVDVEPDAKEVRYGTTELLDALRPFVPHQ
ncbi:NAD(P)H-binding domain-containing protein [Trichoderma breve]|uniref:NAD(P)H-binding domain-containing protein n=1 Tax=Trichoderma breve TaxID=2034170 RepID=A0A9W9E3I5_9HYPO|nr:NAD(P)H-binding domain-containing protein [Trichoderma breve]KAJ4856744.1 NAD(P)H-binding domain-containing protein [Trichoderma breve]